MATMYGIKGEQDHIVEIVGFRLYARLDLDLEKMTLLSAKLESNLLQLYVFL